MSITIRNLRHGDSLKPPLWPLGVMRPASEWTLVAVDDSIENTDGTDSIVGILWLADGGKQALIGVYLASSDPLAVAPLCMSAIRMAEKSGRYAFVFHVRPGRHLDVARKIGCYVVESEVYTVTYVVRDYKHLLPTIGAQSGAEGGAE